MKPVSTGSDTGLYDTAGTKRQSRASERPGKGSVGMKVKSSVKRRTKDCQIVRRRGKVYVINKKDPRMKQRQG